MLLNLAAGHRVLLLGGKGGVGKTAIASAVALAQARAGRRVRLVSTDPAHNLGDLWEVTVGDRGAALAPGLDAVEIDPAATTDRHLRAVRATLRRLMPEHLWGEVDRHLALAAAAPGMHEAAVLERLAQVVEEGMEVADLVVVDTAPSGHTAHLLGMPEAMAGWTQALLHRQDRARRFDVARGNLGDEGLGDLIGQRPAAAGEPTGRERDVAIRRVLLARRDRLAGLRDTLTDHAVTAFVIVLAAERLPVLETVELEEQLRGAGLQVAGLVVNRRSPGDAGPLLARRRLHEDGHLAALEARLGHLPLLEVPLLGEDLVGPAGVGLLAEALR